MNLTPGEMLTYLRSRGCRIGGVTMGAKGLLWYDETKNERFLPALDVPERLVIDTTAPATSFTVPTSIRIWSIPMPSGSSTSSSRARHRHIRSSISATKRACPRWRRSTRPRRGSASGGRLRSSSVSFPSATSARPSPQPCAASVTRGNPDKNVKSATL